MRAYGTEGGGGVGAQGLAVRGRTRGRTARGSLSKWKSTEVERKADDGLYGLVHLSATMANPPLQRPQAQPESGVRGNVPAPFGAGERLQSPTYRSPAVGDCRRRPGIVGKVPAKATRWRPTLLQARFWNNGGRGASPTDCSGMWHFLGKDRRRMAENKDYFSEKLQSVERAREEVYFRKLDQELIAKMRQSSTTQAEEAARLASVF